MSLAKGHSQKIAPLKNWILSLTDLSHCWMAVAKSLVYHFSYSIAHMFIKKKIWNAHKTFQNKTITISSLSTSAWLRRVQRKRESNLSELTDSNGFIYSNYTCLNWNAIAGSSSGTMVVVVVVVVPTHISSTNRLNRIPVGSRTKIPRSIGFRRRKIFGFFKPLKLHWLDINSRWFSNITLMIYRR